MLERNDVKRIPDIAVAYGAIPGPTDLPIAFISKLRDRQQLQQQENPNIHWNLLLGGRPWECSLH